MVLLEPVSEQRADVEDLPRGGSTLGYYWTQTAQQQAFASVRVEHIQQNASGATEIWNSDPEFR